MVGGCGFRNSALSGTSWRRLSVEQQRYRSQRPLDSDWAKPRLRVFAASAAHLNSPTRFELACAVAIAGSFGLPAHGGTFG
jgi:hypothetical protein